MFIWINSLLYVVLFVMPVICVKTITAQSNLELISHFGFDLLYIMNLRRDALNEMDTIIKMTREKKMRLQRSQLNNLLNSY